MKSILHSHKEASYSSVAWYKSKTLEGVRYAIRRISLQQRIELTKSVRELVQRNEFLQAGDGADQLEAALGELWARKLYLEWGLDQIEGLSIDGEPANKALLIDKGPETLAAEILATIRAQLELQEDERKNS